MTLDVTQEVEPYLSRDQARWAKLSSDVGYRRLHLLLLREILLELRKLNATSEPVCEWPADE
jgi:hypothetical protein